MNKLEGLSNEAFEHFWSEVEYNEIVALRVTGTSMTPFLLDGGSIVYIVKKEQYHYKRGGIYLYRREDGSYVLHRIYQILDDEWLLMNGDAQVFLEKLHKSQIVAEVVQILRKKRIITPNNHGYQCLVWIWRHCRRLRPYFAKGIKILRRK